MSRRRWGRRLLWGLLGGLAFIVLAVVGVLVWATSAPGERFLVGKGLQIANEQFSGKLEIGGLDLAPPGAVLTGVKLYDPEGELVAEIARVEARVRLGGLLQQQVRLTEARIEAPRLYLAQDERGLNLSRAIAPRVPKPEEPPGPRGKLRVDLDELVLQDGYVDFRQELEDGGERHARLEDLDAKGLTKLMALDKDITDGRTSKMARNAGTRAATIFYKSATGAKAAGQWARAMEYARRALQADPGHAGASNIISELKAKAKELYFLAYAMKDGNPEDALPKFKDVVAMTPPDDEYHDKAKTWVEKLSR